MIPAPATMTALKPTSERESRRRGRADRISPLYHGSVL